MAASVLHRPLFQKILVTSAITTANTFQFFASKAGANEFTMYPLIDGRLPEGTAFLIRGIGIEFDQRWDKPDLDLFADAVGWLTYQNQEANDDKTRAPVGYWSAGLNPRGMVSQDNIADPSTVNILGNGIRIQPLNVPILVKPNYNFQFNLHVPNSLAGISIDTGSLTCIWDGLESKDLAGLSYLEQARALQRVARGGSGGGMKRKMRRA